MKNGICKWLEHHKIGLVPLINCRFMFHMNYVIEGVSSLVNEAGEEQPLKTDDIALVKSDEKHQYLNKGDQSVNR